MRRVEDWLFLAIVVVERPVIIESSARASVSSSSMKEIAGHVRSGSLVGAASRSEWASVGREVLVRPSLRTGQRKGGRGGRGDVVDGDEGGGVVVSGPPGVVTCCGEPFLEG